MKNKNNFRKLLKQAMAQYYIKAISDNVKRALAHKRLSTRRNLPCKEL